MNPRAQLILAAALSLGSHANTYALKADEPTPTPARPEPRQRRRSSPRREAKLCPPAPFRGDGRDQDRIGAAWGKRKRQENRRMSDRAFSLDRKRRGLLG